MSMTKEERIEHLRRIGTQGGATTRRRYGYQHYQAMGVKGGDAVAKKFGREFYSQLGKKSAAAKKTRKEADTQAPPSA